MLHFVSLLGQFTDLSSSIVMLYLQKARISRISEIKMAKENAFLEGKERFRQSRELVFKGKKLESSSHSELAEQYIHECTELWTEKRNSATRTPNALHQQPSLYDACPMDVFEEQYYHLIDCLQQTTVRMNTNLTG